MSGARHRQKGNRAERALVKFLQAHGFAAERGIQLVCDEVYHPIYYATQSQSAARLPHATVIGDLSKAFSIPGVRTGWIVEHDTRRRQQYWTARAYFTITNSTTGEILSEIAIRKRDVVLGKTQEVSTRKIASIRLRISGSASAPVETDSRRRSTVSDRS